MRSKTGSTRGNKNGNTLMTMKISCLSFLEDGKSWNHVTILYGALSKYRLRTDGRIEALESILPLQRLYFVSRSCGYGLLYLLSVSSDICLMKGKICARYTRTASLLWKNTVRMSHLDPFSTSDRNELSWLIFQHTKAKARKFLNSSYFRRT